MSVLVALPSYDGTRLNGRAVLEVAALGPVRLMDFNLSLLARAFNECWAAALNERPDVTHFLMVHADVVPQGRDWPVRLRDLMSASQADVMSVVLPIKTSHGLTSTALETADPWHPRPLSFADLQAREETWTEPGLLVNTGLMLVNMQRDWVEQVHFHVDDRVVLDSGRYRPESKPEDWNFSRDARAAGASVWATRAVRATHLGYHAWPNWEVK